MHKKNLFLLFSIFLFFSCSKGKVIFFTDPVYHEMIFAEGPKSLKIWDEFSGKSVFVRDNSNSSAFFKAVKKNNFSTQVVVIPVGNTIPDISEFMKKYPSDIVVLSPLLNKRIDSLSSSFDNRVFFLPDAIQSYGFENVVVGVNDRAESFYAVGQEVAGYVEDGLKIVCVFYIGSQSRRAERNAFYQGYDENTNISRFDIKAYEVDNITQKGFVDEIVKNAENVGIDLMVLFGASYNSEIIFSLKESFEPIVITEDFDPQYALFYRNIWKTLNIDYSQVYSDFFSLDFTFPKITKEDKIMVAQKTGDPLVYDEALDEKKAEFAGIDENLLKQKVKVLVLNKDASPEILIEQKRIAAELEKEAEMVRIDVQKRVKTRSVLADDFDPFVFQKKYDSE
ncbi:MAG: hypothetical protein JXR63_01120 [Spirochaetales bacterium]|nr:hypothetical protein [Spirochaetales bacterium]